MKIYFLDKKTNLWIIDFIEFCKKQNNTFRLCSLHIP